MTRSSPWGQALGDPPRHLYLAADAAAASDQNPGNVSTLPLKTIDEAIRRVNALHFIPSPTVVHFASAPINGYRWTEQLGPIDLGAPLVFIGDGAGQVMDDGFTELLTGTLDGVPTKINLPILGGGLTPDGLVGRALEMTSGTQAGWRRSITQNGAADIDLSQNLDTEPLAGDTFRITSPSVRVTLGSVRFTDDSAPSEMSQIVGVGQTSGNMTQSATYNATTTSILYLVNLQFGIDIDGVGIASYFLTLNRSTVCLVGTEFIGSEITPNSGARIVSDSDSLVMSGLDFNYGMSRLAGLTSEGAGITPGTDNRVWGGWSAFFEGNGLVSLFSCSRYAGFIHSDDGFDCMGGHWWIIGGRIKSTGKSTFGLRLAGGADVTVHGSSLTLTIIDSDEDATFGATILVRDARLVIGNVIVRKDNQGTVFLVFAENNQGVSSNPGQLALRNTTTIEAIATVTQPTNAVRVTGGSRCNFFGLPTIIGAFVTELAVAATFNSVPAVGSSGSFAGLAAAGDAYPTVASGLTGVNGWIQRH